MPVRLNRQVKAELDDIWLFIAEESSSLEIADRVVETIADTFLQLSKHPSLGRRRDDLREGLRRINAGSYVVIYRVEGNNIRILHVVHGRRDIKSAIQH
jgi:toxin ParE1/3/4